MTVNSVAWAPAAAPAPATGLGSSAAVHVLLDRLGLGGLAGSDTTAPLGSNQSVTGTTDTGVDVFVKQVDATKPDARQRFARMRDFEEFAAAHPVPELRTPRLLGFDEPELLIAFAWLRGSRTGNALAEDDAFTEEMAYRTGRATGALHAVGAQAVARAPRVLDTSPPMLPPLAFLEAIPLSTYVLSSGAMLDAWRLLQNDGELRSALTGLRARERAAAQAPAHCDLRLDQLLWHEGDLYVCDWEEFRLADPARDVGSYAGEWLYRAVLGIPEGSAERAQLSHRDIVDRGVSELTRLRSRNTAFWVGYREAAGLSGSGADEVAARATAFAGWHLIDRMIASAEQQPSLDTMSRAASGIGRTALLRPEKFARTIGLEG
ncbi:class V lanthionine synthetase subunit LxmK [Streptomyces sp. MH13]|uniref:class V lanthionine synthetase subunit LxmK n=1 Tax=Streptomyces sp. MH13 TaxID=3417651 RepID=UPI003CFB8797